MRWPDYKPRPVAPLVADTPEARAITQALVEHGFEKHTKTGYRRGNRCATVGEKQTCFYTIDNEGDWIDFVYYLNSDFKNLFVSEISPDPFADEHEASP